MKAQGKKIDDKIESTWKAKNECGKKNESEHKGIQRIEKKIKTSIKKKQKKHEKTSFQKLNKRYL